MAIAMRESSRSWQSQLGVSLLTLLIGAALLQPGVLVGAGLAALWFRRRRPPVFGLAAVSLGALVAAVMGLSHVAWAWPWRLPLDLGAVGIAPPAWRIADPIALTIGASAFVEALVGPAWFAGFLLMRWTREGMPSGMIQEQQRKLEQRRRQLGLEPANGHKATGRDTHFQVGIDAQTNRPLELTFPDDIAQHVTVLGKMGTGKTTTAARLVEGAVAAGWPVVIIDAKGFGSLRLVAKKFADGAGVPFRLVAPDDDESMAYNPCVGKPAQISNKLIGAFNYGPEAEVYKNIAQEVLPVLIRALQAAGRPVTLGTLYEVLAPDQMVGLMRHVPDHNQSLRDRLRDLSERRGLHVAAYAGMRGRFGALLEGEYGQLLSPDENDGHSPQVVDMATAFDAEGGITYFSLPALAAPEDVELMARVLAQDVKQVAAARIARGEEGYALLILDEFAGLREASQLHDLLLQAREARFCCVVCTQFLPTLADAAALRQALLSAGIFMSHQLSPEDAEIVAGLFGTKRAVEVTHQVDYGKGTSEKGSMRQVDEYRVHPNELRDLRRGMAAVRIEPGTRRIAIVHVTRPQAMEKKM